MRLKEPAIRLSRQVLLDYSMIWILKTSLIGASYPAVRMTNLVKKQNFSRIHGEYAPHVPERLLLLSHKLDTSL